MSMTIGSLEGLQEEYRSAFNLFAQAVDRFIWLQQCEQVDFQEIQRADRRVREAQDACREARDRLALVLLERRSAKLKLGRAAGANHLGF